MDKIKFKQYIFDRDPVIDLDGQYMFFANLKVCKKSIAWNCLKHKTVMQRGKNKSKYIDLFNECFENFDKIFKFTIVRNPWDRVVSAFHYLQQIHEREPRYHFKIDKNETFKNFIKTQLKLKGTEINAHFHSQYMSAEYEGKIYVDYIGKFENLKKDWKHIASVTGAPPDLLHINASKHGHYTGYYDKESVEIVKTLYTKDIELFGYSFGGRLEG